MTVTQYKAVMEKLEQIEKRVRRMEGIAATLTGGIMISAFLIANGLIKGV